MVSTLTHIHTIKQTKRTKRVFLLLVGLIAVILELFYFLHYRVFEDNYLSLSIIICLNLLLNVCSLVACKHKAFSFLICFVTFYYLFHFGEVIMQGFFPWYKYEYLSYLNVYMTNPDDASQTLKLSLICINMFVLGALCFGEKRTYVVKASDLCGVRFGKTMFYCLLPFRLFYDARIMYYALNGNYASTFNISFTGEGIISSLASICTIAAMIYYLETSNKNDKYILIISVAYLLFNMLSGGRGHSLVAIISFLIVFFAKKKPKITIKKALIFIVLVYFLLVFVDLIYDLREVGFRAFINDLGAYLISAFKNNILFETIGSFGETIFTPYLVVQGYGKTLNPFFGEGFIKSLASIVPDAFSFLSRINKEAVFTKMLNSDFALGGSFAGDLYYNFGSLYWLFAFIIGYFYSKFSYRFNFYVTTKQIGKSYKYLAFLGLSMWWIRDSVGGITRDIVWCLLLIFIFEKITNRKIVFYENLR